jgi:hypothetical protein
MSTIHSKLIQYNIFYCWYTTVLYVMPVCNIWGFEREQYAKLLRGNLDFSITIL